MTAGWPFFDIIGHHTLCCTKHAFIGALRENLYEDRPTVTGSYTLRDKLAYVMNVHLQATFHSSVG